MARIRSCKPEFYDNESLADLSLEVRYLYRAMWHWLDMVGLGPRGAKYWKAKVFPYDEKITTENVECFLQHLITQKRLFIIDHDGKQLLYCPDMPAHQHFHKSEQPKYSIPQSVLYSTVEARCKHGTNTVPAALRSEIGDLRSEIGDLRTPTKFEIIPELQGSDDEVVSRVLHQISQTAQQSWVKRYRDRDVVYRHLREAIDHHTSAEGKEVDQIKDWGRKLVTWLRNQPYFEQSRAARVGPAPNDDQEIKRITKMLTGA